MLNDEKLMPAKMKSRWMFEGIGEYVPRCAYGYKNIS